MQTVLDTKGALVNAVVEGEAMAGDVSGSVLDVLERALRAISPGLADAPSRIEDDDLIERLLREASEDLRTGQESGAAAAAPFGGRRRSRRFGARSKRCRACCRDRQWRAIGLPARRSPASST